MFYVILDKTLNPVTARVAAANPDGDAIFTHEDREYAVDYQKEYNRKLRNARSRAKTAVAKMGQRAVSAAPQFKAVAKKYLEEERAKLERLMKGILDEPIVCSQ